MPRSNINEQTKTAKLIKSLNSDSLSNETYLTFNILGKIYHVKSSLFQSPSGSFRNTLFNQIDRLKRFYDSKRRQYIIDISPLIFDHILEYYRTEKLPYPSNVDINYYRKTLKKFHIDTSSLNIDQRYQRIVPKKPILQLIHVLLAYTDSCRASQILHYICSMMALLSCLLASFLLTFRDPSIDLHAWNETEMDLPMRSKSIIANFSNRSSIIFIIDTLCLVWAVFETTLRILSSPSLYIYFTTIGLFDITGVVCHFIYIYVLGIQAKPSQCQKNPLPMTDMSYCIAFNRRLMMLSNLRKLRLVRYIRPLKHLTLSLMTSKREVLRLIVLLLFIMAFLGPIIFIIESSHIHKCTSLNDTPNTRCIRTMNDAFYYLILTVSTVGYGDIYPVSHLARFIAMTASPLSIMILSIPVSCLYAKYVSFREKYLLQIMMPDNIRYVACDKAKSMKSKNKSQQCHVLDVTEQIHKALEKLGMRKQ